VATEIDMVFTEGPKVNSITRFNGIQDDIAIDNNTFDDAHDFLIEKRNLPQLVIQLQNKGDTNSLSYEIYGSIDPSLSAPAFSLTSWELLDDAVGNIPKEDNDVAQAKMIWIWILIRLKRTTAAQDTIGKLVITSGRVL